MAVLNGRVREVAHVFEVLQVSVLGENDCFHRLFFPLFDLMRERRARVTHARVTHVKACGVQT